MEAKKVNKQMQAYSKIALQKRWSFFNEDGSPKTQEERKAIMEARKRQGEYLQKGIQKAREEKRAANAAL